MARIGSFKITGLGELNTSSDVLATTRSWIHEAGNPFYDWLYGSPEASIAAIDEMLRRPSSECYVGRVTSAVDGDSQVGGHVTIPGDQLLACVSADSLAFIRSTPASMRSQAMAHVRMGLSGFPAVPANELYLSRLGVVAQARGRGLGRVLVDDAIRAAREGGFAAVRLNVHLLNEPAIRLYQSAGFHRVAEVSVAGGSQRMLVMRRALDMETAPSP